MNACALSSPAEAFGPGGVAHAQYPVIAWIGGSGAGVSGAIRYESRSGSPMIRSPKRIVPDVPSVTPRMFTPVWFARGCDPGPVRWNIPSAVAWVGGNALVPPLPPYIVTPKDTLPARAGFWSNEVLGQTWTASTVAARPVGPT